MKFVTAVLTLAIGSETVTEKPGVGVGVRVGVGDGIGVNVAVAVGVEVAVAVAVAVAVGVGACTVNIKLASVNVPQLSVARMVIVWPPAGAASLMETTPVVLSTLIVPV